MLKIERKEGRKGETTRKRGSKTRKVEKRGVGQEGM